MKHQLFHLYSILKILVCFSFILFFVSIFITINKEENTHEFFCGVTSPYNYIESQLVYTDKLSIRGQELFNENCGACHSIYGKKVGPALVNITKTRKKKWIRRFIRNSAEMIAEKDADALALYKEYGRTDMTAFPDLTNKEIDAILHYINENSRESLPALP